jgi:hypothetical protein
MFLNKIDKNMKNCKFFKKLYLNYKLLQKLILK